MKFFLSMRLLSAAGLLAALICVPVFYSVVSAQIPSQPEGADNDGYADLAVGIPGLSIDGDDGAGALGVLYGTASGLTSTGAQYFDQDSDDIDGGPEPLDHFAKTLASGDFNRDGFIDLAIGVPDEMIGAVSGAGLLHILYGGLGGLTGAGSDTYDEADIGDTAETSDHWGAALASGDFNCDGYDDLAVGAPGEDFITVESAGMVDIMYGSSAGLSPEGDFPIWQGIPLQENPEEADNFGKVLAAGDFDGDGCHDLAIGVPNEALQIDTTLYAGAGVVQVAYGSENGISGTGNDLWYQGNGIQDQVEDFDYFGESLAAGDYNNDNRDDLAIGVPKESFNHSDDGIVQLVWGGIFGLTDELNMRIDQSMFAGYDHVANNKFGFALAAGDFNGDGRDDLVASAPGQNVDGFDEAGSVHAMFGSNMVTSVWSWDNQFPALNDRFGSALAIGDVDGNGYADLAVGAPEDDSAITDIGSVYVIRRTASAWLPFSSFRLDDIDDALTPGQDDEFGTALAMMDEANTHMTFLYMPTVTKLTPAP